MTWLKYHQKSEKFVAEAEVAARGQAMQVARTYYLKAAEAELLALAFLNAFDISKARTFSVTVVSAVSLFERAGCLEAAQLLATNWLSTDLLLPFARQELEHYRLAIAEAKP